MRTTAFFIIWFTLLFGGIAYYMEYKYETWSVFKVQQHIRSIDYKRRASYTDMDKASRRPSFQSLVTEHYLNNSQAEADNFIKYVNNYYRCLIGAWEYIEKTKYAPVDRIKPKLYEKLCIPEEADMYVSTYKLYKAADPEKSEEQLKIDVLYRIERQKKTSFYQMYEDLFFDAKYRISP